MTISSNCSPHNDPWQQLKHCCVPEMFCVPKTWSDPFRSSDGEIPHALLPAITHIQNTLVGKPWCNSLALLSLVMAAQHCQASTILASLSRLHTGFEKIFAALNLQTMADWMVDTHMILYLTQQIVETDTQAQRAGFWRHYQASSRLMKRWFRGLPIDQQSIYTPFLLPYPVDSHELTVLSKIRDVTIEQQEKRKEETDAIMPFYADLRTHGHFRYNLLVRVWKAYQQAISTVEKGQAKLPLTFALTEGDDEQSGSASSERVIFKLWDRQTLGREHLKAFSQTVQKDIIHKKHTYADEKNTYLLEFVRREKDRKNDSPSKFWFLELLEHDVLGQLAHGSPDAIPKRRAWLKAHGYEDQDTQGPFHADTPGVLLPPQKTGYSPFLTHLREKVDITLVPIESLWVAATFGMVALSILTANGMRVGEFLQIRASADGIVPITLAPAPSALDQTPY